MGLSPMPVARFSLASAYPSPRAPNPPTSSECWDWRLSSCRARIPMRAASPHGGGLGDDRLSPDGRYAGRYSARQYEPIPSKIPTSQPPPTPRPAHPILRPRQDAAPRRSAGRGGGLGDDRSSPDSCVQGRTLPCSLPKSPPPSPIPLPSTAQGLVVVVGEVGLADGAPRRLAAPR